MRQGEEWTKEAEGRPEVIHEIYVFLERESTQFVRCDRLALLSFVKKRVGVDDWQRDETALVYFLISMGLEEKTSVTLCAEVGHREGSLESVSGACCLLLDF